MVSNLQGRWMVASSTFVVWALVAASCVYWGLKLTGKQQAPLAAPVAIAPIVSDPFAIGKLLGANPAQPSAAPVVSVASRFSLQGVVSSGVGGAAVIVVDGKPPRPFRVGAPVEEGGLLLKTVGPRKVVLAKSLSGPDEVTLELPLRQ